MNNLFPAIKKTISKFLLDESAAISKKSIIKLGIFGCLSGFAAINMAKPVFAAQEFPNLHFNCVATVNCDTATLPVEGLATATFGVKKYFTHGNGFYQEYNNLQCDTVKNGFGTQQDMLNKYYPLIDKSGAWEGEGKDYKTDDSFGPNLLAGPLLKMFGDNNFAHNNNMALDYANSEITATHDHNLELCNNIPAFSSTCQSSQNKLIVSCEGDKIEECGIKQKQDKFNEFKCGNEVKKVVDAVKDPDFPSECTAISQADICPNWGGTDQPTCDVKEKIIIIKDNQDGYERCEIRSE